MKIKNLKIKLSGNFNRLVNKLKSTFKMLLKIVKILILLNQILKIIQCHLQIKKRLILHLVKNMLKLIKTA